MPSTPTFAPAPPDAQTAATALLDAMTALLAVMTQETELVRTGRLRDAMQLAPQKQELSVRYAAAAAQQKAGRSSLAQAAPGLLATLQQRHQVFRDQLQMNLTVLATAHAVSEGVVRGVNAEVQRRNAPQTYTRHGQRAAPSPRHITPIAINRSL